MALNLLVFLRSVRDGTPPRPMRLGCRVARACSDRPAAFIRDHIAAARACDPPRAARLDQALNQGEARRPEEVAKAMAAALLDLPRDDFHGHIPRTQRPTR